MKIGTSGRTRTGTLKATDFKSVMSTNSITEAFGDSGRTRTPNLLIRSQLLYPVELRNRGSVIAENPP